VYSCVGMPLRLLHYTDTDPNCFVVRVGEEQGVPPYYEICIRHTQAYRRAHLQVYETKVDGAQEILFALPLELAPFIMEALSRFQSSIFVRPAKLSNFPDDSVVDPHEVRWGPPGGLRVTASTNESSDPAPFWQLTRPTLEALRNRVREDLDQGLGLRIGRYFSENRSFLPGDGSWDPDIYWALGQPPGEGEAPGYTLAPSDVEFRRRCQPWFNDRQITHVVLQTVREREWGRTHPTHPRQP